MRTLHIAPGDSAGGSLAEAIRKAGRHDEVLRFRDDLSCGPIASDEPQARARWWNRHYDIPEVETTLTEFWQRVTDTDDRLVVWFGRHSALELAFFLTWADRLGHRPYHIIDVTGRRLPFTRYDGTTLATSPAQAVSIVPSDALRSLLGTERPITAQESEESAQRWQRLKSENSSFRVVTEAGLESAPADHFDPLLLEQTTAEWQMTAVVIGRTMGYNSDPYLQTGDLMLLTRVVALVEAGKLIAEGDPWDMRSCRIRLPA